MHLASRSRRFAGKRHSSASGRGLLRWSCLALIIAAMSLAPVVAVAGDDEMMRSVTVQATGSVVVAPDIVRIRSGVQTTSATAKEALSENSSQMTNVIDGLKALGVADKDIQTSNFNVQPNYQHHRDGRPPEITGYQVTNEVDVVIRDLNQLGMILDRLIQLGANQMRGLDFQVSQAETLRDDARREAIANARRRAELYAAAAGTKVGKVLEIREGTGSSPEPRPMVRTMARAADVPVEAGEETLSASVTVTWALE